MTKYKKKSAWIDIFVLSCFPLIAVFVSLVFKLNFFTSTFFFFVLPAIYLSFKTKKAITRSLLFSLPFSIIGGIFIDHLAALDKSWHVPTIFSVRLFNTIPFEDLFWAFSLVYLITIFYEHFLDKGNHTALGKRMKYFLFTGISLLSLLVLLISSKSSLLHVNYWYIKLDIFVFIIPILTFFLSFPRYLGKFLRTAPYFVFVGLSQEITALRQGYWSFPGQHYIGWVSLIGYRFPVEEFLFWFIIFSTCVLCYFEFFDDNKLQLKYSEESKILKIFNKRKRKK